MMNTASILIIEDDEVIRELLTLTLQSAGYAPVIAAADGCEGMALVHQVHPSLILLDLMLPGIDGFGICSLVREDERTRHIPIIMLTALSQEAEIVKGLDLGANDYITKPFSRKVLLARIRAQLRNAEEFQERREYRHQGILLNAVTHLCTLDGKPLEITAGEFSLLQLLLSHPGQVFTRRQIQERVYGEGYLATPRAIDVQIVSLRRKLGSQGNAIETVRGVGYRLKESD